MYGNYKCNCPNDVRVSYQSSTPDPASSPTGPTLRTSASYMGCRHCEEGSLVFDPDLGTSRCRACGATDD